MQDAQDSSPADKDNGRSGTGDNYRLKQVRENFYVVPKSKNGGDIHKRYDIETNIVSSKKRRKLINSDVNKYFIKSLGEETKALAWGGKEQGSKELPLEELGLVKTHQDQEVSPADAIVCWKLAD